MVKWVNPLPRRDLFIKFFTKAFIDDARSTFIIFISTKFGMKSAASDVEAGSCDEGNEDDEDG